MLRMWLPDRSPMLIYWVSTTNLAYPWGDVWCVCSSGVFRAVSNNSARSAEKILAIWRCLLTREMPFLNHSKGYIGAKRRENFRILMPFLNDSKGISARSAEKILAILGLVNPRNWTILKAFRRVNPRKVSVAPRPKRQTIWKTTGWQLTDKKTVQKWLKWPEKRHYCKHTIHHLTGTLS